jgi:hypothetical protein
VLAVWLCDIKEYDGDDLAVISVNSIPSYMILRHKWLLYVTVVYPRTWSRDLTSCGGTLCLSNVRSMFHAIARPVSYFWLPHVLCFPGGQMFTIITG